MAQATISPATETETSAPQYEERNPPPGVTFWTRGDGAFSITYAPLCDLPADEMYRRIRAWLDEREAKHTGD